MATELESLTIGRLAPVDVPLFEAHFTRHRAESGRGEPHFMPFEPDDAHGPKGLSPERLALSLRDIGWQRWFVAWAEPETTIVGHVDLKGSDLVVGLHRCELGIGIERAYRGRGLGKQLMQTAIEFAVDAPTIGWLDLRVFAHNQPARTLYKQLGFRELGTLVDCFRISGASIDDVIMTLAV